MNYGYFRVAAASPTLSVADCAFNANQIVSMVKKAAEQNVRLLVFPELSLTGYTCGDLFAQQSLYRFCLDSLHSICDHTKELPVLFCIGIPVENGARRFNCASFIYRGRILALIPKTFIPNRGEFYERRWFSPFTGAEPQEVTLNGHFQHIPFGTDIIIQDPRDPLVQIAAELCEDLWAPLSPSARHAVNGATVIANLSASNEIAGKESYRRLLVSAHSAKTVSAYIYANAGHDESTTDMVFSGHSIIAANGTIQAELPPFSGGERLLLCDIDLEKISRERLSSASFSQEQSMCSSSYRTVIAKNLQQELFTLSTKVMPNTEVVPSTSVMPSTAEPLHSTIEVHPFVPEQQEQRAQRCRAVIEMQAEGLAKRLRHIHAQSAVIGLSGGLDSTLALLVCARAADKCGLARHCIRAVTMPAFGTTGRTYANACSLAKEAGASLTEIDIRESVIRHFADIGHNKDIHDTTYENAQARERTQILMDIANMTGGIVIGTGDLSELALGWCTYSGDQMSMYGVNASIPKTLVRHLVSWFADEAQENGRTSLAAVLHDILHTPVSPELLPPENGTISQKTEELVGPYELHDFFLYYAVRWGFSARKIFFLADRAFCKAHDTGSPPAYAQETVFKWLKSFYQRFFSQQFKRSCMPDGAKAGTVSLSPRGDWRMPSDASAESWMQELEEIARELHLPC